MIEVSNISRYYGRFAALKDVSFTLKPGQVTGIVGLNGAGKSTALRILAGLMEPSAGVVTMDGEDVSDASDALRARIGFLPESPPLYEGMTVSGYLTHVGKLKGMSSSQVAARLPAVLAETQLNERRNQLIETLSHGFRKRVGIAMAIVHDPKLVILDEPISGLDPVQIRGMRKVIRTLANGRAVLLSSHILTEISKTCDQLLVLHDGEVIARGTQQELADIVRDEGLILTVRGEPAAFEAWLADREEVSRVERREAVAGYATAMVGLLGSREALLGALSSSPFLFESAEVPASNLEEIFTHLVERGAA